jgi:hypothetical protein
MKMKRAIILILCLLAVTGFGALTYTYNVTTPPDTGESPRLGASRIRELKNAVWERMNNHNGTTNDGDHYWPLDSSAVSDVNSGQHRMVTLRQMSGNPSALTSYTARTDLSWLYQKNVSTNGELYWEDEALNVLQVTSAGKILGDGVKWSNNTYLVAKDAAGTGTVNLIKADANDIAVLPDGAQLATTAAPTVTKGIANKKYVDDTVAALMITPAKVTNIFGAWETKSNNTQYTADKDGFVCAIGTGGGTLPVRGETPTGSIRMYGNYPNSGNPESIMMPVRSGDTWKVFNANTVYWLPIGN